MHKYLITVITIVFIVSGNTLLTPRRSLANPHLQNNIIRSPAVGLWLAAPEVAARPTTGPAWDALVAAAQTNTDSPNIRDNDNMTDVYVLAKALVYVRTGEQRYRAEVLESIMQVVHIDIGERTQIISLARNVQSYVIAADLINLPANMREDRAFRDWLDDLRTLVVTDGPDHSIISCHELRPNNFGTHCGAARIAIARYLGDQADLARAAQVFRGWLGDRTAYDGFAFGDLWWQCDPERPVAVNPAGCTKQGRKIGGVLPDDQRRSGDFAWPPPQENYAWEALQGAVVQAELLHRAGYLAWQWQDQALLRAIQWLYDEASYPATGDDDWIPWLVNQAYGVDFAVNSPTHPGKGMGWTDWSAGGPRQPAVTPTPIPTHQSPTATPLPGTTIPDTPPGTLNPAPPREAQQALYLPFVTRQ